ncbi:MAG TPA: IPT/TIG domain-containing protein [Nitrospira sp.]
MVKPLVVRMMMGLGTVALLLAVQTPSHTFAAEPTKKEKQKAAPQAKSAATKPATPKFQSAEKAGKASACFGQAPKIEKLTPDEGKAGDKVTIRGSQFGSKDCLSGVSFGPSHPAQFTVQNDTTITATVPSGGRKGLAMVTVTTASGEDSKAFLLK